MRVAMGLALREDDPNSRAIEFYNLLSSFDYMASTPTLFNSGTRHSQLSSCYLTTVSDDLEGIYGSIRDNALLSKWAGGLGNDWTPVRALGSRIKGTNGQSQGVVPFLKVVNDTAVAVNQGGKRKGAVCAYLESWHLDIEEFLELRKNTGDERRRTHDMNTANWIPDLFMKRVFENETWTLFSPDEAPELHDIYGAAFEKAYTAYEEKARRGEIRCKTLPAISLWRKILSMLFETGHPWVTFKDACNLRSPQQHVGVIHSSNLCTEITLNTSKDEIAVCNLGSINLVNHIKDGKLDTEKLSRTIKTAVRMLDNVIDINYYSVPQAKNSNLKHRPVGLGLMGFQYELYAQNISYASDAAVEFADRSMEYISYYTISASVDLAIERGTYESYEGSLWSRGILPIDSIKFVQENRGNYMEQDATQTLDWDALRQRIKKHGIRNSNIMAIAPTATISNICGVSQSIEPTYQNLFVKSNLSGEFTVINPYLVRDLKKLNLWDNVMVHDLKYYNGSLQKIERIPDNLKKLYATAFEIAPRWLVDAASRRQKWIDQSQSLNLYMAEPSGKKLDVLYRMAWLRGLKTTYYLRSLGATDTEKATINDGALNAAFPIWIPGADWPEMFERPQIIKNITKEPGFQAKRAQIPPEIKVAELAFFQEEAPLPTDFASLTLLSVQSVALALSGRYRRASGLMFHCRKHAPNNPLFLKRLANRFRATGHLDKAKINLKRALEVAQDHPGLILMQAELLQEADDHAAADQLLSGIADHAMLPFAFYKTWEKSLRKLKSRDAARDVVAQAAKRFPDHPIFSKQWQGKL